MQLTGDTPTNNTAHTPPPPPVSPWFTPGPGLAPAPDYAASAYRPPSDSPTAVLEAAAEAMHAADCGCATYGNDLDGDEDAHYYAMAEAAATILIGAGYADGRKAAAGDIAVHGEGMEYAGIRAHWRHAAHIAREGLAQPPDTQP